MNNITSEGLSLLLSTGPLSYITDKKVPVNFSKRDLPQLLLLSLTSLCFLPPEDLVVTGVWRIFLGFFYNFGFYIT